MGYVVKVTNTDQIEVPVWLSTCWPDGSRSLVCLEELAAVFRTSQQADEAIADLPDLMREELEFSVEPKAK